MDQNKPIGNLLNTDQNDFEKLKKFVQEGFDKKEAVCCDSNARVVNRKIEPWCKVRISSKVRGRQTFADSLWLTFLNGLTFTEFRLVVINRKGTLQVNIMFL